MQESINPKPDGRTAAALASLLNANKANQEKPEEPQIAVSGFDAFTDPNPSTLKCVEAYVYPRSPFPLLVPHYSSVRLATGCTCGARWHSNKPSNVTASLSNWPPLPPVSRAASAHTTSPRVNRSQRFSPGRPSPLPSLLPRPPTSLTQPLPVHLLLPLLPARRTHLHGSAGETC